MRGKGESIVFSVAWCLCVRFSNYKLLEMIYYPVHLVNPVYIALFKVKSDLTTKGTNDTKEVYLY